MQAWSCVTDFCKATAVTQGTEGTEQEFFRGKGQKNEHNHVVDLSMVSCLGKTLIFFFF